MGLLSLGLVELTAFALVKIGKTRFRGNLPAFSINNVQNNFWGDFNEHFGVWHAPLASFRHKKPCFDVEYKTNSYGARDREREIESASKRVLVLGDSVIEGYGVARDKRFTDLLEKATRIEHLNFGTSGNFGPTQYYLLYKTLASKFSHDEILIGIFPANDFTDNDYEYGKLFRVGRYRPYLVGEYPDYRLIYHEDKFANLNKRAEDPLLYAKKFLVEFSYTSAVVRHWFEIYRRKTTDFNNRENPYSLIFDAQAKPYSGYYDFTPKQFDLMKYSIEKIAQEAAGKKMKVLLIPSLIDIQTYDTKGPAPLSKKFRDLEKQLGIAVFDLLPTMHDHSKDWGQYFFSCDPHWNETGHRIVFEYLKDRLYG